jgi:hypothetical protein
MRNPNKPVRYFGEICQLPNGQFKVAFVNKLVSINQYKNRWEPTNSREFARALKRGQLVTN